MNEESRSGTSYGVRQRAKGRNLRMRILLILSYITLTVSLCLLVTIPIKMPQLIAIVPTVLLIVVPPTWRPLTCDIEYTVDLCLFTVERVYSFRRRKVMVSISLKEAGVCAMPYTAESVRGHQVRDFRGNPEKEAYCLQYSGKNGKPCALLFETTPKLLKSLARHTTVL